MDLAGADHIFCLGGVQALAAMAFGMEDVEPVDMSPARQRVRRRGQAPALRPRSGSTCSPAPPRSLSSPTSRATRRLVAADLLGQAEHGPTSPAVLITTDRGLAERVRVAVDELLTTWPTAEVAGRRGATR